jgi:hypothetical protein
VAVSVRDQIMSAIEARFALIATGYTFTVNGCLYVCQTDIGQHVFKRRAVPMDETETEMLVFVDTTAPARPVAGGFTEYDMTVEIGCEVRGGDDPLGDAVKRAEDVLAAIGSDPSWGGLAENTSLNNADLDFQVNRKVLAGFIVPVRIKYQAPNWTM